MGNREKLIDGALSCLYTKGFARTTARDVAGAAGVSLAAIGYHFGTTEALLSIALVRAMEQWGDELERTLIDADPAADPAERFVAAWQRVIDSVRADGALWSTQFEIVSSADLRAKFVTAEGDAREQARFGLAALFEGIDPATDPDEARQVGAFYQVLLTGVVAQHLTDPDHAITGAELLAAIRTVAARRSR